MRSKSGVIGLLLLAGLFTVSPYAIYDGSVRPSGGPDRETMAVLNGRSIIGAGAGGMSGSEQEQDCRSCAKKSVPGEPVAR